MITAEVDMTAFNQGIQALMRSVGATSRFIVEKETGELIKELVKISPPSDAVKKTKQLDGIRKQISKTFQIFGKANNFEYDNTQASKSGMKWYAASSKYLFGGAPDTDMRKANTKELLAVHYRRREVQGSGRIIAAFKNRKTSQRVAIITKIITAKKQVEALIKRVQKNVGRLKAGWLVAARDGKVRLTGANLPPVWVKRHVNGGTRGRADIQLDDPTNPHITITNFAKGVRSEASLYWVNMALRNRAGKMLINADLYTRGKKNLADYSKEGIKVATF